MDLLNPVYTEKAECQDCYKCLRECTVKAIKVEGGRAAVVPEYCVLCGHCVEICPVGAKRVRNDLSRAKMLLQTKERVIVSLAPAFASEFPDWRPEQLVAALKKLGFWAVSETARGADLNARKVAEALRDSCSGDKDGQTEPSKIFISSACPTVVEYIKKYHPAYGDDVTAFYSPLLSHAEEMRSLYGDTIGIIFIGPCISKKRESDLHRDLVDVAIDFKDLAAWFEDAGINPQLIKPGEDDRFMPDRAAKGALYPMDGGMIASVKRYGIPGQIRYMAFSGITEIDRALSGLSGEELPDPIFLELLACSGGCINGPRSRSRSETVRKRFSIYSYAEAASETYNGLSPDLANEWQIRAIAETEPRAEEIAAALRRTGKFSREDELNCGGCGYDTCRDFARAMLTGKAEQEMCVSYMRKLAQKKANSLIRSIPSGIVIVGKDLRIVECNYNFVKLIGGDAEDLWAAKPGLEGAELGKLVPFERYFRDVLYGASTIDRDMKTAGRIFHGVIFGIEQGEIAGGVFQDVTAPWVRKDRVISQARKVITKNLAVVQKIAYLLGENAAETEATLNSIIESFGDSGNADGEKS